MLMSILSYGFWRLLIIRVGYFHSCQSTNLRLCKADFRPTTQRETLQFETMSLFRSLLPSLISVFLLCLQSSFAITVPQTLRHTNLLRTIDLSKAYVRDSTALILENFSNSTQTIYYWGIPHDLVPKLSYLEAREKKSGVTELFPVEHSSYDHP